MADIGADEGVRLVGHDDAVALGGKDVRGGEREPFPGSQVDQSTDFPGREGLKVGRVRRRLDRKPLDGGGEQAGKENQKPEEERAVRAGSVVAVGRMHGKARREIGLKVGSGLTNAGNRCRRDCNILEDRILIFLIKLPCRLRV